MGGRKDGWVGERMVGRDSWSEWRWIKRWVNGQMDGSVSG